MDNTETQSITNISSRAIFGPVCLLLGLSLLYFQESSQFVTLTASALLGLMTCWKWEKNGLYASLTALFAVVIYQWLWSDDSLTLWEFGLSSSFAIAFITTTLAKTEINDIVEEQSSERIEALQGEYLAAKEMLQRYEKIIREKSSKIDALEKNPDLLNAQDLVKRYESAIHEKNIIIDELHERLDKVDNPRSDEQSAIQHDESLQTIASLQQALEEVQNKTLAQDLEINAIKESAKAEYEALLAIKNLEIDAIKADAEKTVAELSSINALLAKRNLENEAIRAESEKAITELSSINVMKESAKAEYEALLAKKDAEIEAIRAKGEQTVTELAKRNSDNENAIAELNSLKALLKDKDAEIEAIRTGSEESIAELNLLKDKSTSLENALAEKTIELNAILEASKADSALLQEKEKAHSQELIAVQVKVNNLESELENLLSSLHHEQDVKSSLEKQIDALQEEVGTSTLKDRKIQQLEESYKILRDQVKEHESFNFAKLIEKDRMIEKNLIKVKELEHQVIDHESKVKELSSQLEELLEKLKKVESEKEELEETIGSDKTVSKNFARVEGMYRQLREQFEAKTEILNKTRKELFIISEQKAALELNYLEENKYDRAENLVEMEKYILDLTEVISVQEKEIEVLQDLVSYSMKQ